MFAWDANGEPVELVSNGEYVVRLPADTEAAYPITIDPDSTFVTSASDGYTYNDADQSYPGARDGYPGDYANAVGTAAYVGQDRNSGPVYRVYRAFLYFDTSGLSAASDIANATLLLRASSDSADADFSITVTSGMPNRPADPFTTTDYRLSYYNTTSLGSVTSSGWGT
jgi:hypothetical protein